MALKSSKQSTKRKAGTKIVEDSDLRLLYETKRKELEALDSKEAEFLRESVKKKADIASHMFVIDIWVEKEESFQKRFSSFKTSYKKHILFEVKSIKYNF